MKPSRNWKPVLALAGAVLVVAVAIVVIFEPFARGPASGEQASSQLRSLQGGLLDGGLHSTCALLDNGAVRCWGIDAYGQLGYGNTDDIGDNETPGSVGPVDLGAGRTAVAISAGAFTACALLDNGAVRCWGDGSHGKLGYGNTKNIGDNETPGSVGPVDLGAGRTAVAISAGGEHTCALLDNGMVRCWGYGAYGRLGYGNSDDIGDNETPGSVGPVDLGAGRTAVAISAGGEHTCALLDNGQVRCWGTGARLGYGNTDDIGDNETPGAVGPVDLGAGRTAVAISAGGAFNCALLDNGQVRCWGYGGYGQLGYGNTDDIGDNETPGSVGPVDLGAGRTAVAISAGGGHTCALLDNGRVRCWGLGERGELGYGNTKNVGDDETPGSVGTVDLGAGRTAVAISAGAVHTCVLLDDGRVRCWGWNSYGELGYGSTDEIGDDETPGSVGPVDLGGLLSARVGDVSLTLSGPTGASVGDSVSFTATLANGGPDPIAGLIVALPLPGPLSVQSSTPSQGTYDSAGGSWPAGTLAPGSGATLELSARVQSAGTITIVGELIGADAPDPDSVPGNGNPGEDDRAVTTLRVPEPPTPPAAKPGDESGPAVSVLDRSLKLKGSSVPVKLSCPVSEPAGCTGGKVSIGSASRVRIRGTKKMLALGSAAFELAPGQTSKVRVKASKAARHYLDEHHSLRVVVKATARDQAGNTGITAKTLKLGAK